MLFDPILICLILMTVPIFGSIFHLSDKYCQDPGSCDFYTGSSSGASTNPIQSIMKFQDETAPLQVERAVRNACIFVNHATSA